jgi:hypothetical protein
VLRFGKLQRRGWRCLGEHEPDDLLGLFGRYRVQSKQGAEDGSVRHGGEPERERAGSPRRDIVSYHQ